MNLQNFTYIGINLLIVIFPLILSFFPTAKYWSKWKSLFLATIVVAVPFIFWDIFFTEWGVWSFNPNYITGIKIINLPLAEASFFFTVPFACLFIYGALGWHFPQLDYIKLSNRLKKIIRGLFVISGLLLIIIGLVLNDQTYSVYVFILTGTGVALSALLSDILLTKRYWFFIGFSFLAFLIMNSILTGIPIVSYDPAQFSQIRIGTIPLEDFFYNYLLLTSYAVFFKKFTEVFGEDK